MNNVAPKPLYKYRSFSTLSLKVFINKELYFCDSKQINDPFDCAIKRLSIVEDSHVDRLENHFKENFGPPKNNVELINQLQQMKKTMNSGSDTFSDKTLKLQKKLGIFSLSADAKNILMWSHYADNHKGFCIEFVDIEENIGLKPVKVKYEKEYPILNQMDNCINSVIQRDRTTIETFKHAITTKFIDWEYEQEYRIINGSEKGLFAFPEKMINRVIFGWKMDKSKERTIINLLNNNHWSHVQLKKAIPIENKFELEIVDYKEY